MRIPVKLSYGRLGDAKYTETRTKQRTNRSFEITANECFFFSGEGDGCLRRKHQFSHFKNLMSHNIDID